MSTTTFGFGIDIPEVLLELRATVVETEPWPERASEALLMQALGFAFGSHRRFVLLEWLAGRLGRLLARRGTISRLPLPGWAGAWLRDRDLVPPAAEPFRHWWRRQREAGPGARRTDGAEEPREAGDDLVPQPVARATAHRVAATTQPTARETVLARLAAALADQPPVPIIRRPYRSLPSGVDPIERFVERLADYRAPIERFRAPELPAAIAQILAAEGARRVAVPVGLPADWLAGITDPVVDEPPLSWAELDAVGAVVTGCAVAIAETGTIVLDAGAGQGRRALSLLPDLHVCIVRADQIVGEIAEALERLDPRRPLTWISGPSATSDIELNRVEGVHGPRRLVVLLVEERP